MPDRIETLGELTWDLLQRLVRELVARKPGGYLLEPVLDRVELRVPLAVRGEEADPARFAELLTAALDAQLDDAVEQIAAFRPGRVWCHRCRGSACEHAEPPSCRHVFVGYAPTGLPRWEDFAQYCLERKLPEVDRLYADPPALLTLVQPQRELSGGMLAAFHSGSTEILAQVIAGFYAFRARAEEGRGVLALTLQIGLARGRRGRPRVGLNLIGRTPAGEDL
ncbi:MAG TPA: hypothetical protein VJS92_03465, partial [Candidatus Polarisedimenticolaceae bacterium]|nr:hypothetical protein [Candidatus Polarisedimenticolaceae bacterium]